MARADGGGLRYAAVCNAVQSSLLTCAMPLGMNSAASSATSARGANSACASVHGAAQHALRLLLVDDCRVNRMLVTAVLTWWGIVPTMACNGSQAVIIAERQRFDIVLMDILMPVMDGVVATTKIRRAERENPLRAQVPIIACTSLDLGTDPVWLNRVGLSAVLPKPCNATSLRACLSRWCPDKFVES
jgi:CheY-like chemotaxis protein